MGLATRIRDVVRGRRSGVVVKQENVNWIRFNELCSAYENLFAQVRPLVDEMKIVVPYGVGRNGARLAPGVTPELAQLLDPNEQMGWSEFMDAMLTTWLTEDELNIHVWKNARGRVYGYTILPLGCRVPDIENGGSKFVFTSDTNELVTLYPDEVMTLRYSRSPRDLDKGVSPASSVYTWTQIDDLMAQYQKSFIENGAVPAYITRIKASTYEKYRETRKDLEKGLKGAKNRNKTLYLWSQFDNDTGASVDQVEVQTIQGNNSTLAIKELLDAINDKINKAYGVSNFILGDDSTATYHNAEQSDRQFTKRRVYPALMSFWNQFQHELDRVVDGLGYAISFDLDIPELTDRLKVKAEITKTQAETLTALIQAGSLPGPAVEALGLDPKWTATAMGIYDKALAEAEAAGTEIMAQIVPLFDDLKKSIPAPAKAVEAVVKTTDAYTPVFSEDEEAERKIHAALMTIIEDLIRQELDENVELSTDEVAALIDEILTQSANDGANTGARVIETLVSGGTAEEIGAILAGDGYHVSEAFQKTLAERTKTLLTRFESDMRESVAKAFETGADEGLGAGQIARNLRSAGVESRRAELIARNETVHAFSAGRLENDEYLAQKYSLNIKKIWRTSHDGDVCPVCAAMDGQTVDLRTAFPDHAHGEDEIEYGWDQNIWNNDGEVPHAHPNCRCYFDEVIE